MVEAGGSLVGGVGVSGAPGGEADEACAKAGIEAVRDKMILSFYGFASLQNYGQHFVNASAR